LTANNRSYTATIEVATPPSDVFEHLTRDVSKWWGGKDLEGSSNRLGDEFTIRHGDVHYSRQKVVEFVPGQRLTWLVTESTLSWIEKDMHEWTNTRMVFELSLNGDKTVLRFTHEGLVPEMACHARCAEGWDMVIKDWLFHLIADGQVPRLLHPDADLVLRAE
jgi:uncharacterized protein YndB with AHSA1/START domain